MPERRHTLNLSDDELAALFQLERAVEAGRAQVPRPLWAQLTTVRAKVRHIVEPPPIRIGCRRCGQAFTTSREGVIPSYCSKECREGTRGERSC